MMSRISDRRLLNVSGGDMWSVINGISTSNINTFASDEKRVIQHTLFLNNKGRIISDVFIVKPMVYEDGKIVQDKKNMWIESYVDHTDDISSHIHKYSFRKDVIINDVSDRIDTLCVYSPLLPFDDPDKRGTLYNELFGDADQLNDGIRNGANVEFGAVDPRCENLGLRLYVSRHNSGNVYDEGEIEVVDEDFYDILRYFNGILQWGETKDRTPGKVNFDVTGSIDLSKGCFLGQELTARTHYTGVVRKRPFLYIQHHKNVKIDTTSVGNILYNYIERNNTVEKKGRVLWDSEKNERGSVLFNRYNYCVCVCEYIDGVRDVLYDDEGNVYTKVSSEYFREDINRYIDDIHRRKSVNELLKDV